MAPKRHSSSCWALRKLLDEKRSKRADARQKRRDEMEKAMAEQSPAEGEARSKPTGSVRNYEAHLP